MNNNFLSNYFKKRKISFKLLILTLLFSALITFIITLIQLYMDYKNGIKSINTQFSLVESGYLASINQSIWVFDNQQISLQLDSIVNLPDIEYAAIDLIGGEHYERGEIINENRIGKSTPLHYVHDSKQIALGELTVVADLNKLYEQLIDKIIVILFSQGIKTFLVSFFILFLFQRLVTRHLEEIAKYAKSLRMDNKSKPLVLDKVISSSQPDELDLLTESINSMQIQLHKSFRNISEELERRREVEKSLVEYKKALDASAYVSKSDLEGNFTYVNDALCAISGYTREELIGEQDMICKHDKTHSELYTSISHTIQNKKIWKGTLQNTKKDGSTFYTSQTIIPIIDTHGEIIEYITTRHDITELTKKREDLDKHYKTDRLTGLDNRNKLLHDIDEGTINPAVAIIDIDSFREVNDFYGHEIGDQVIVEFANRLYEYCIGKPMEAYRLQADQFALLCHSSTTKEEFEYTIETLIENLTKQPIYLQQYEIHIDVTVGIAMGKSDLFINADIALKMAKKEKKNYITYHKSFNIKKEYEDNLEWTNKLKKALHEERIVAFFQPIYNIQEKKIVKFEALVRMVGVDGEIISPAFFLDIAKKTKLYSKITMLMIDKAIDAAKHHPYSFSINFTIDDIITEKVKNYFIESIKANNIGHKIVIELVESEGIENFKEIHTFIKEVKKLGCRLAIDDFGTGYSNFEYLLKLDVDYIKIDGSLIKNIDTNRHTRLVTKNIIAFAKVANIKTIAEFVAHKEIADILHDIDIDYLQGYHIGIPMPLDKLSQFGNL